LLLALIGVRAAPPLKWYQPPIGRSASGVSGHFENANPSAWLFNHERCALQYQVGNRNMHYRFSPDTAFKMILPVRRGELACAHGGKH